MFIYMAIALMTFTPKDDYVFVPDDKIRCTSFVGDIACPGTIDKTGRFIPDYDYLEKALSAKRSGDVVLQVSFPKRLIEAQNKNEQVYEFRSGRLVPMVFDAKGFLVPETGEEIVEFRDYEYTPQARRIYNLPGRFVLKNAAPKKQ